MNKSHFIAIGLAFSFALAPASDAHAQCKNRLINKSFSCSFRSDSRFSPNGRSCLEFEDRGTLDPPKFDLIDAGGASIDGLVLYNCSCDPMVNSVVTRFNRSRSSFTCSGNEFVFTTDDVINFPWEMWGRISPSGRMITGHQVDISARSYLLQCTIVPSCRGMAASAQKFLNKDAEETQRYLEDLAVLYKKESQ